MNSYSPAIHHPAGLAFDSIAEQYDDIFTRSLIGRAQRAVVWEALNRIFHRGDYVLELNCGTGEDALFLARLGVSVLACDASEKMISVASRRQQMESPDLEIGFEVLPTERIGELREVGPFDGVFSNFSGLNCVADLATVARQLARLVKPRGSLLLCVSSRVCLWEIFWFLAQGDPGTAVRRWKGSTVATLGGFAVEVHYPTLRDLRGLFAPSFLLRSFQGVGVAVPPSYLERLASKYPKILHKLQVADTVLSRWPLFRTTGDHVLLSFERTGS